MVRKSILDKTYFIKQKTKMKFPKEKGFKMPLGEWP